MCGGGGGGGCDLHSAKYLSNTLKVFTYVIQLTAVLAFHWPITSSIFTYYLTINMTILLIPGRIAH